MGKYIITNDLLNAVEPGGLPVMTERRARAALDRLSRVRAVEGHANAEGRTWVVRAQNIEPNSLPALLLLEPTDE